MYVNTCFQINDLICFTSSTKKKKRKKKLAYNNKQPTQLNVSIF